MVCEKNNINTQKNIYYLAINVDDITELKFIELSVKRNNIVIGITHRPPSDKFELYNDYLSEILRYVDLHNKKCFLMLIIININIIIIIIIIVIIIIIIN